MSSRQGRAQRFRRRMTVAFGPDGKLNGFTTNVSATGFGLTTRNVSPRGTPLSLKLVVGGAEVRVQGVVAWSRRNEATLVQGAMGIRVTSPDEGWYRFIAELSSAAAA